MFVYNRCLLIIWSTSQSLICINFSILYQTSQWTKQTRQSVVHVSPSVAVTCFVSMARRLRLSGRWASTICQQVSGNLMLDSFDVLSRDVASFKWDFIHSISQNKLRFGDFLNNFQPPKLCNAQTQRKRKNESILWIDRTFYRCPPMIS